MRITHERMGNIRWTQYVVDHPDDIHVFRDWVDRMTQRGTPVGVDTETTGLNVFLHSHRLRLIQFGTPEEAWLLPVEYGEVFAHAARYALRTLPKLVIHNAAYDTLVIDRHLGIPVEELWPRIRDTRIYAHLYDPRREYEGGTGHALKNLAAHYVDPQATDGQRELAAVFREHGLTRENGWAQLPLDTPAFLTYAGADVVLVTRLLPHLLRACEDAAIPATLAEYEHRIARIGTIIRRKGMRLDLDYTRSLVDELENEAAHYAAVARRYGVTSVHATAQVAAALQAMGETLTETTATGQLAVGKEVLLPMADLDTQWRRVGAREPNPLADAVLRAKRAQKWAASYGHAMLQLVDPGGRIHPDINTLGARTGRWSVSNPPLQQLPSSDWRVRRCVVAEPGHLIAASDLAQVELRVLVALAGAERLIEAINQGQDLHSYTTRMVFSIPESEPVPKDQRSLCKTISLGKAYAGGARTLARQTGLPLRQVQAAVTKYDRALPEIARFSRYLTRMAQQQGMTVRTPSGRLLRLDRDKTYTAIAYLCQSTARDVLGQALVDLDADGLLPYVIGVVHDEILVEAPRHEAQDVINAVGERMRMPFFGVQIESDPEIYGTSWGDGYGCPDDRKYMA